MSNLLSIGRQYRGEAVQAFAQADEMEQKKKQNDDMIKQAQDAEQKSNQMTGAGIGGMMAMGAKTGAFAGPMGIALGAALGYLAGSFL